MSHDIGHLVSGEIQTTTAGPYRIRYVGKPNTTSQFRFDTLLTKEPETIAWIEGFAPGETLWDIGANVGIYSLYAAMRGITVVAFEPCFANYFQLCANIAANGLQDRVLALCLAFAGGRMVSTINLAGFDFGVSMSTFGSDRDFRGQPFQPVFRQGMVGVDIDSFVEDFAIDPPDHVKIDVDGIEPDIVRGGEKTLSNPRVKSVSVELVDTDPAQVDGVGDVMRRAGFRFVHKKHNAAFCVPETMDVFNFLYRR